MKRPTSLLLLLAALAGAACSAPSADELVEEVMMTRVNYDVEARSWIIRDESDPPEIYIETFVINNNQDQALRTLTVLVEQYDVDGNLVAENRVALDVAELTPGIGRSIGVTVPAANMEVDGLVVRREIQPDQAVWGEFPEFERVRPRI